ncbi:ABC transporter ATP-binding protein [Phyllobacterium brassicacearum]|uniref:ABC transporter ATP-binding protein n=1 Tax=Phyllobacterium brassicacearum TaxID=314235 RepID=A0A2P7BVL2_9HYPH|nr:ATP-binding cassette domain-containing protein [Phyllobacterium brassicacearum]PSH70507.1 ABC transporter ATP-binding protein [Phyllobacterium brassicacearum]TDQ36051.1 ABC-2 type transport system ATP-binding protein [Phyllobacterium brassicacearum]
MTTASPIAARSIHKSFRRDTGEIVKALEGVSFEARQGTLTALVGPDGAGKTTLLRLIAGLMTADSGELSVLDVDVAADPQNIQNRIGYMPQKFGLYEDLSVQQNLDLYADLHGISRDQRREIYPRLMEMTDLGRFTQRLAGKLSGGMKQKLGLACTLVRSPELLLLDEPTVGVDPLSRRELWDIVTKLVHEDQLTVVVSTSYLDEAELCDHAVVMHLGKVLAQGKPGEITAKAKDNVFIVTPGNGMNARSLQARLFRQEGVADAVPEAGKVRVVKQPDHAGDIRIDGEPVKLEPVQARFEDGFMVLFSAVATKSHSSDVALDKPKPAGGAEISVEVHDLVRTFGDFTAVNHVSFQVKRGEIYGLLGPNGAGKSTTFRMLCGLMPATHGTLRVAGADLRTSRAEARQKLGYVAQKFSLYGDLSVDENLDFFASAYGLRGQRKRERIAWSKDQFELGDLATLPSGQLPGGFKQRLAMAAALLHEPDILFLDEATSGADPLARREFWGRITALSEQGVTVIVTTHFMEEAEYCDRIIILDAGRNLAEGTPAEIRAHAKPKNGEEPNMEDAFIAIVEESRRETREKAA